MWPATCLGLTALLQIGGRTPYERWYDKDLARIRRRSRLRDAATACSMGDSQPGVVVRDSAGVEVVETGRPMWPAGQGWRLSAEPILSIGRVEGDPEYQLHEVAGATRLSDGRIIVADAGSGTIRYYYAQGRFLRAAGRKGEGPGEFQRLQSIGRVTGDSLFVFDAGLNRITVLDGAGTLVSVFTLRQPGADPLAMVDRLPDGRWLVRAGFSSAQPGDEGTSGLLRSPAPVFIMGPDGSPVDTLGVFPGLEMSISTMGGRPVMGMAPYGRTLSIAVHGERVHVGTGDLLGFDVYSHDGRRVRSIRAAGPDRTLRASDLETFKAAYLARIPDGPARDALAQYLENAAVPEGPLSG